MKLKHNIVYIDEAGDLFYYKWYRNPLKWFVAKRAWRKLGREVKMSDKPIVFTGADKIITHEVEL